MEANHEQQIPDIIGREFSRAVAEVNLGWLTGKGTIQFTEQAATTPAEEALATEEQS